MIVSNSPFGENGFDSGVARQVYNQPNGGALSP